MVFPFNLPAYESGHCPQGKREQISSLMEQTIFISLGAAHCYDE
jgi:hypothetical protein